MPTIGPIKENNMPNLQTFSQQENAKVLSGTGIRKILLFEKSAKPCKSLLFLQTFALKSLISLLARKTGRSETWSGSFRTLAEPLTCLRSGPLPENMRTGTNNPNCRKSIVFAKKSLPDYSVNTVNTDSCEKRRIPFLRKFSQLLRNLHICFINAKINNTNKTVRNQNAEQKFPTSEPNFFSEHCITNPKKSFTIQKA